MMLTAMPPSSNPVILPQMTVGFIKHKYLAIGLNKMSKDISHGNDTKMDLQWLDCANFTNALLDYVV